MRQRTAATEAEREHRVREPGLVLTPMCALSLLVEDPSVQENQKSLDRKNNCSVALFGAHYYVIIFLWFPSKKSSTQRLIKNSVITAGSLLWLMYRRELVLNENLCLYRCMAPRYTVSS